MNILIIGNGFDLAHGLPTKYEHFLKFMYSFIEYKTGGKTKTITFKEITKGE